MTDDHQETGLETDPAAAV